MAYKIKAIVKRPDEKYGHMTNISNSLQNLQRTVEGYIETLTITDELVIICNEEGLIKELPFNVRMSGVDLVGTIIVCGVDGDEFGDIPISFQEWKKLVDLNEAWRLKGL